MVKKRSSDFLKLTDEEIKNLFSEAVRTAEEDNKNEEKLEVEVRKAKVKTSFPDIEIGVLTNIDKRNAKRLKRGKMKVEATLDLHGYSLKEAESELYEFIDYAYSSGKRCIRVITGKGLKSSGSVTIYSSIESWLNRRDIKGKIITVSYAPYSDGGKGAIYILLRKNLG